MWIKIALVLHTVFQCIFHWNRRFPPQTPILYHHHHHYLHPEWAFLCLFCLSAPRPPSLKAAARVCSGGLRWDIHNLSPTFHATLCALVCARLCVRVRSIIFSASFVSSWAKIEFQPWGFTSDSGLCVNGFEASAGKWFPGWHHLFYVKFHFCEVHFQASPWSHLVLTILWQSPSSLWLLFRCKVPYLHQ